MHEPELYHKGHREVKSDAARLIKKYLSQFQWQNDGSNMLIDLGSGPGDVFMDNIYPQMPKNFRKAICTDISREMLQYAQNYYKNPDKCEFRLLDIATEEELPSDLKGHMHQVTSIFLIHWLKDYRRALQNMYALLRPQGGECLIIFMPVSPIMATNDRMRHSPKWRHLLQDVEAFIPACNHSKSVERDFRSLLQETGFSDITTELVTKVLTYDNFCIDKETLKSVCSLLNYIPEGQQSEFLDDYFAAMLDINSRDEDGNVMDSRQSLRYKFLAAHAKRLPK